MQRTWLFSGAAAAAITLASTLGAEAGGPHQHHVPYPPQQHYPHQPHCGPVIQPYPLPPHYGYARPRPVYAAPIYQAPVYPAPIVVPSYQPYPVYGYNQPGYGYGRGYGNRQGSGLGVRTDDFSFWIGR